MTPTDTIPTEVSAITPEPALVVTDVDFTRNNITGEITLDGYRVTITQSFTTDRMGLFEFDRKLSDQADAIAHQQALEGVRINQERRMKPNFRP